LFDTGYIEAQVNQPCEGIFCRSGQAHEDLNKDKNENKTPPETKPSMDMETYLGNQINMVKKKSHLLLGPSVKKWDQLPK
jgi:hypothetical protein